MSIGTNGIVGGRVGTLGKFDCGGLGGVAGTSFFTLLFSLWQQRVKVLTEGDVVLMPIQADRKLMELPDRELPDIMTIA